MSDLLNPRDYNPRRRFPKPILLRSMILSPEPRPIQARGAGIRNPTSWPSSLRTGTPVRAFFLQPPIHPATRCIDSSPEPVSLARAENPTVTPKIRWLLGLHASAVPEVRPPKSAD